MKSFHQGESDWGVISIDQGVSVDDIRRRESYRNYSNLTLLLINAGGQKWPKACN